MRRPTAILCSALAALSTAFGAAVLRADEGVRFNRDVRPLLSDRCFLCHGPDGNRREAGLRLDTAEGAVAKRDGTPAIVPGDAAKSELFRRITASDPDDRMPPPDSGKELSADEIELLRRWIDSGAEYEPHWSFIPAVRRAAPPVEDTAWPRTEIDRFVLARIEAAGLRPSESADPVTLARRLAFDIIGLPPTPAEVAALASATDPAARDVAHEGLVDRLLASPHFGERMAVYWLDLVRYADSVGYHGDQEHHASPYRDWVIRAFNDNMPFDRFTLEQIAGDLLPDAGVDQKIASCYNRLLQTTHEGGAQDGEYLAKYGADRVRNLSAVWLGATLGCAECHDHKYDPYTQRDFYSLKAFFADIQQQGAYGSPNSSPTTRPPEIDVHSPADREELARLDAAIAELEAARDRQTAGGSDGSPPADAESVERRIAALRVERDAVAKRTRRVMITVSVEPRTVRVLRRGDWMDRGGDVVGPAVPHFLEQIDAGDRRATRLELARWLVSGRQPQVARVFVNRLWYLFFGAGLSRSLDDTGSQGDWPSHPDLLDWLAVELVESGWDVKRMVKLIVMSSTYRQSSVPTPALRELDPENRLLARQSRFRLPAEMIRDAALAVSGLLVDGVGGPVARPYQPAGYYAHLNFPKRSYRHDSGPGQYRRGVYTHWQRQFLHPMLRAFDAPTREECTAQRPRSNTPLAALTLLNDPSFVEAARVFASRILREGGDTVEERVRWAWRVALSRSPDHRELAVVAALVAGDLAAFREDPERARKLVSVGLAPVPADLDVAELAAWTSAARAILNLDEMITRH